RHGRRLQEVFIYAAIRELRLERRDQLGVPAGMHDAETPGIDEQGHLVEPAQEFAPLLRMILELRQGLAHKALVARAVLAHMLTPTPRWCRRAPAQGVELVVAHDAQRLAGTHHVMHQVQDFTNARTAVDQVAKEDHRARRMAPHAALPRSEEHTSELQSRENLVCR